MDVRSGRSTLGVTVRKLASLANADLRKNYIIILATCASIGLFIMPTCTSVRLNLININHWML